MNTREAIAQLPAYRPGKSSIDDELDEGITEIIKLSSNENPLPPVQAIIDAITSAATGVNRYPDHRATALRASIAGWAAVTPEQVTVGPGSVGLLQQLMLTYIDPGDEVVFPWRSFEAYPIFTQLMGGIAVNPPLVDHAFDLDAVIAAVSSKTKMILLATPNNPTGTALSTTDIRTVLDRVSDDVLVVVDEAYKEFMDPALGDPARELLPDFPNLVVLRTFSKTHGLAGIRAGYALAHPEVIDAIDKTLIPFAVNVVAQAACIAAIESMDEIMLRVHDIVSERTRVSEALSAAGWTFPKSEANFVYLPLGNETEDVFNRLQRKGVITRPFPGEGLRVTIGTPAENDRFLAALGSR